MKNVKTFKNFLLILLVMPFFGIAQSSTSTTTTTTCKTLILQYIKKMESMTAPKAGEVYHVKYSMETHFAKHLGISSSKTSTEVYSSIDKLALYDKKMQVFGDDTTIFVVVPEHQKIYWNNSDPKIFNDANAYKKFMEIQKVLLDSADQVNCVDKGEQIIVRVLPSKDFTRKTKLISQQIVYSNTEGRIVKVDNTYDDTSKIRKQTVVYETLDFQSSKKMISPIAALFDGKELKTAYRGFEIIDNRQN